MNVITKTIELPSITPDTRAMKYRSVHPEPQLVRANTSSRLRSLPVDISDCNREDDEDCGFPVRSILVPTGYGPQATSSGLHKSTSFNQPCVPGDRFAALTSKLLDFKKLKSIVHPRRLPHRQVSVEEGGNTTN